MADYVITMVNICNQGNSMVYHGKPWLKFLGVDKITIICANINLVMVMNN